MSFVDIDVLERSCNISAQNLGKFRTEIYAELPKIFKKHGIMLVGKVADITPPMKNADIEEKAITRDVFNIFKNLKSISFKQLVLSKQWEAVRMYEFNFGNKKMQGQYERGNYNAIYRAFAKHSPYIDAATPRNIVPVPQATVALHNSARERKNGTLGKWDGKTVYHVAKNYRDSVGRVLKDAKAKIGSMVGGWVMCAKMMNGVLTGIPDVYASRGRGSVSEVGTFEKQYSLIMRNELGDYNAYLSNTRRSDVVNIMNAVANSCERDINNIIKKRGDSNFK